MHILQNICELIPEASGVGNDTLETKKSLFCQSQFSSFKHRKKYKCYNVQQLYLSLYLVMCLTAVEEMQPPLSTFRIKKQKVREKSRECHNHKPQPFPDTKRKRKPTNPNNHKSNKNTKSTKIRTLFPKRGNRNAKRTEKHKKKNDTR